MKHFGTPSSLYGGGPCLGALAARQEEAGDAVVYSAEQHLDE
jgi:hypothetical protein